MANPSGFLKYERKDSPLRPVAERILDFEELQIPPSKKDHQRQAARCMAYGIPFCYSGQFYGGERAVSGCSNDNLIPEWNDLLYEGDYKRASEHLSRTNPFPGMTGRVYSTPCEEGCTEGFNGLGITIHDNERFIIDTAFENGWAEESGRPAYRTGFKVTVIDSGPAGLSTAWRLSKLGHTVAVYERGNRFGGLLIYGIPNMKLDREIVQRCIDLMEKLGINFVADAEVGRGVTTDELLKQYDRAVLTTGASAPRDSNVPGRHLSGICFAVGFLAGTTKNILALDNKKLGPMLEDKHALVIGGGDTGNDRIGTAVRLGTTGVKRLEITPESLEKRLPTSPWPQYPMIGRVGYGQEEANFVQDTELTTHATSTTEFIGANRGQVIAAETIKVSPGFRPIEGTEEIIKADLVLLAMRFAGAEESLLEQFGVQNAYDDYSTSNDHAFVAGDVRRSPSLVIWGICEGRKAAEKIGRGLRIMIA